MVEIDETKVPDIQALNAAVSLPAAAHDLRIDLPRYLADNNTGVALDEVIAAIASPDVRALFGLAVGPNAIPDAVGLDALHVQRPKLQKAYQQVFADFYLDALLFPTTTLPARQIGQDITVELNGQQVSTFFTYIRNTDPDSNAGLPGLSIPVGLTRDGLPVGLELDGPAWCDRKLLAIGLAVEEEFGSLPAPTPERLHGAI